MYIYIYIYMYAIYIHIYVCMLYIYIYTHIHIRTRAPGEAIQVGRAGLEHLPASARPPKMRKTETFKR